MGIGWCGIGLWESRSLASQCSVFSAEAAAIFQAILQPSGLIGSVLIATDSASTIAAILSDTNKHPWIQEIQKVLDDNENITLMWVPGHSGIAGNEEADRCANTGRDSARLTDTVPSDDLKSWLREKINNAWRRKWYSERSLFTRKIKGDVRKWEDRPDRREQIILSRLRTGHTRVSHSMSGEPSF